MYCREDTPHEVRIVLNVPNGRRQFAERILAVGVAAEFGPDTEALLVDLARVVAGRISLRRGEVVGLTDLIDGGVVPGLLYEVEELFMAAPDPVLH
jgi:hypothetical protein